MPVAVNQLKENAMDARDNAEQSQSEDTAAETTDRAPRRDSTPPDEPPPAKTGYPKEGAID